MIADPPFEAGADHDTPTCPLPGTPDTPVGAPGTVAGVTGADALDAGPVPTPLVAVTMNVYAVPFVNPLTVQLNGPDDQAHVAPPGDAVAV